MVSSKTLAVRSRVRIPAGMSFSDKTTKCELLSRSRSWQWKAMSRVYTLREGTAELFARYKCEGGGTHFAIDRVHSTIALYPILSETSRFFSINTSRAYLPHLVLVATSSAKALFVSLVPLSNFMHNQLKQRKRRGEIHSQSWRERNNHARGVRFCLPASRGPFSWLRRPCCTSHRRHRPRLPGFATPEKLHVILHIEKRQ